MNVWLVNYWYLLTNFSAFFSYHETVFWLDQYQYYRILPPAYFLHSIWFYLTVFHVQVPLERSFASALQFLYPIPPMRNLIFLAHLAHLMRLLRQIYHPKIYFRREVETRFRTVPYSEPLAAKFEGNSCAWWRLFHSEEARYNSRVRSNLRSNSIQSLQKRYRRLLVTLCVRHPCDM